MPLFYINGTYDYQIVNISVRITYHNKYIFRFRGKHDMLRLREAIDENTLTIIQKMFMQYLNGSTILYDADGSIANSIFEGK